MSDSLEVTDFCFHENRRFRLYNGGEFQCRSRKNNIESSSKLGITIVTKPNNELLLFPTKQITEMEMTKENMNVEVSDLNTKLINLQDVGNINDMGINSSGELLAILHTAASNVFVNIYDIKVLCESTSTSCQSICKTRIGTDPNNQGVAFEWNPAIPDMFAASSSDNSLIVAKINTMQPQRQSVIGAKKIGTTVTAISWSPKGKQLTVGDSTGKLLQLKPELDVVRNIAAPEGKPFTHVTGLCWLATTEWMVSYGVGDNGAKMETFILKCKKDKPAEWIKLNELSYESVSSSPSGFVITANQFLIDWNLIIAANSKISQLVPIGKYKDDWQSWTVDEGKEANLPTTKDGNNTYCTGITVDLSSMKQVKLTFDGSQMFKPSPVLLCLNNDGVLSTFHVINKNSAHKDVQVASQNIAVNGMQKLKNEAKPLKEDGAKLNFQVEQKAAATDKVEKQEDLELKKAELEKSRMENQKKEAEEKAILENQKKAEEEKQMLENKKREEERVLLEKKKKLLDVIEKVKVLSKESSINIEKLVFGLQTAKETVEDGSAVVKQSIDDTEEVINELKNLIFSIKNIGYKTLENAKGMDCVIKDMTEFIKDLNDPEAIIQTLLHSQDSEKVMRFSAVDKTLAELNEKYVECTETVKKIGENLKEKQKSSKTGVLSPFRMNMATNSMRLVASAEEKTAINVMRNITRIIMSTRDKLQKNELDYALLKKVLKENGDEKNTSVANESIRPANAQHYEQTVPEKGNSKASQDDIVKARKLLMEGLKTRKNIKTRSVKIEAFKTTEAEPRRVEGNDEELDTSNLSRAIEKFSMTPRRVVGASSIFKNTGSNNRKDATTQADQPIEKVIVTVETPAPVVNVQPKIASPKVDEPKVVDSNKSMFGTASKVEQPKSFFGASSKVEQPKAVEAKSSIFGSSDKTGQQGSVESNKPIIAAASTPQQPAKAEETKSIFGAPSKENSVNVSPVVVKEEPKEKEQNENSNTVEKTEAKPEVVESKQEQPVVQKEEKKEDPKEQNIAASPTSSNVEKEVVAEAKTEKPSIGFSFNSPSQPSQTQTAQSSSLFGTKSPASSSIFGGTQTADSAKKSESPAVSFSFNNPSSGTSGFGSFGGSSAKTSFGAAAASSAGSTDIGMEDESMSASNNQGSGGFGSFGGGGGGFMSGLGSSSANNSGKSVFGSAAMNTSGSSNSWIFNGSSNQQKTEANNFSFAAAAAQTAQQSTPGFGAKPSFGAKPAFGSSAASGGALSKNSSIFGSASGGGFAQFSNAAGGGAGGSSLFGGGSSVGTSGTSSIFGGGSKTLTAPNNSSIFGGSTSQKSNFSTWR